MRSITRLASLSQPLLPPARAATAALLVFVALAAPLPAQRRVEVFTQPGGERRVMIHDDRPMIGVTTAAESERADTLGLRITDVTEDSPAAKAGLKVGDRIQAVNGVNLRADRADAGEEDYDGVLNRRLQREVQATKAGESVELRVLSDGQSRTVRVAPVPAQELVGAFGQLGGFATGPEATLFRKMNDRAVLGLSVTSTGTLRDTAGVFVQSVSKDGPAEKAGIYEGDRIAAVNGVSLKVSREDAEDASVGATRSERLARELAKLKVGDAAELTVVSAGRSRTVRVTTVRASELNDSREATFDFGGPRGTVRMFRSPEGGEFRVRPPDGEEPDVIFRRFEEGERPRLMFRNFDEGQLKQRLEELMPKLRELQRGRRSTLI
jgi:serine protease Do